MDTAEALRSIRFDLLEYIQEKVIVDFDNDGRLPVEFTRKKKGIISMRFLVFSERGQTGQSMGSW